MAAAKEAETPPRDTKKGRLSSPNKPLSLFCSPTRTDQGDTNTCRFHTIAKMIIHLFFDKHLLMNDDELKDYARCMPLETPSTRTYTEADCSKNGYLKIMLFYYFFHLAQKMDIPSIKGNLIQELLNMPPIDEVDVHLFDALPRISEPVFGYQVQLDDPSFLPEILNRVIKPILRTGFYIELGLEEIIYESEDDESEESIHPEQHIVLIVGADESNNVGIKK